MDQQQRITNATSTSSDLGPGQVPGVREQGQGTGTGSGSGRAHLQQGSNNDNNNTDNNIGSSHNNQLSSVYRLLQTPESAAQLQLWRYQLPSPQFTQSAYSSHDSAQKAAVDRAGRFAQGPVPWRNALSPPDSAAAAAAVAVAATLGGNSNSNGGNTNTNASAVTNVTSPVVAPASISNTTVAGGTPGADSLASTTSANGFHNFPTDTRRNAQEAIARNIAERYRHRPISEYAAIVKEAEIAVLNMDPQTHSKTLVQIAEQNRERERQVYALLWLMKNCQAQPDSYVPRGRVFAQYAASCAQNGLKPLSQASLGKLIRAVFPDLTTRRLGMRGQSRYHYCGLKLVGSIQNPSESYTSPSVASQIGSPTSIMTTGWFSQQPSQTSGPSLSLLTQQPEQQSQEVFQKESPYNVNRRISSSPSEYYHLYTCHNAPNASEQLGNVKLPNDYEFVFMENLYDNVFSNEVPISPNYSLKFPRIPRSQLPPGSDEDIVSALESLYHVHCNTIFEHIRFMRFDQLPNCLVLFGSGSISPQMYNLFTHESLHYWVFECDMITHVSLIKCLSRMISDFNNVPANSIDRLEEFARSYDEMTTESIIDLPVIMVTQKTEIVKYFSRLVRKLIQLVRYLREAFKALSNFQDISKHWLSCDKLDDLLYVINKNGYEKIVPIVKRFMSVEVTKFVDGLGTGNVRLDTFVRSYCEAISSIRDVPAYKIMECIMMFSNVFMANISIEMQQNGYPWYVMDILSNLLIGYCYELSRIT